MNTIIPIASGKGGVGKSLSSVALGISLARAGKTVIIVDLDLGGSNVHTLMGIRNTGNNIGTFINQKGLSVESLIQETNIPRLFFISGDGLFPGTANIPFFKKQKLIKELKCLVADYILLDLGGGSTFNILDFYISSNSGIIVTTPETTAILNAYGFIKSALFRRVYRSFPPRSEERAIIDSFMKERLEGSATHFDNVIERLNKINPVSAKIANDVIANYFPRIILNMVKQKNELTIGTNLRGITKKNLNIDLEFIGYVPYEPKIGESILKRTPFLISSPSAPYSTAYTNIAKFIIDNPRRHDEEYYEGGEDLKKLFSTDL